MGTAHCQDAIFETMRDVGMRGLFGKCMLDLGGTDVPAALMEDTETCLRESERLMNRWHMSAGGRLRYAFAPRFVPSCTETLLTRTRDMARANGVRLHTHASENKGECAYVESLVHMRNLRYLHSIGYTGEDVILAHCIWIDDDEIRILADTGTHAVHCPSSNMKLASGIARIDEMLAAGCRSGSTGPTTIWTRSWSCGRRASSRRCAPTAPRPCHRFRRWKWPPSAVRGLWGRRMSSAPSNPARRPTLPSSTRTG